MSQRTPVDPDMAVANLLAMVLDSNHWYDRVLDMAILACYERYDGDKAWPRGLREIPNWLGDRLDDVRRALTRRRARRRLDHTVL